MLRIDPENRFIHGILAKLFSATSKQLKELSAGSFIYAGLFLTEGVGLLLQKHWAEYLTVITTGALIPLEVYELVKSFSTAKLAILAVNVVIVWYLISRIRARRGELWKTRYKVMLSNWRNPPCPVSLHSCAGHSAAFRINMAVHGQLWTLFGPYVPGRRGPLGTGPQRKIDDFATPDCSGPPQTSLRC